MAANKILNEFTSFIEFAKTGFKYNLQTFPDTLTGAAFLFSLLFQSPPLASLAVSVMILGAIHPMVAGCLGEGVGGTASSGTGPACSGRFPGVSFERLTDMSSGRAFGPVDTASWPSYYATFLGFITAYIGAMPFIYNKELDMSPRRKAASIFGSIVLAVVVFTCLLYRWLSECDTLAGLGMGMLFGTFFGLLMVIFLAWISDRRLTNILAFPLIRDRAPDGKPIYVCERKPEKTV